MTTAVASKGGGLLSVFKRSLAAATLLRFSIRITVVVLVVAALSYWHIVSELEVKTHAELLSYISERGQKEGAIFKLAEDNHQVFKDAFVALWRARKDEDPVDFSRYFILSDDGATRIRREIYDGMRRADGTISVGISGFIGKTAPLDSREFRNRMILCFELVDRFAMAWANRFADTYCHTPENANIVAWPGIPWAFDTPADFEVKDQEWSYIADPEHDPSRAPVWTGLYYDPSAKAWMASLETPIDIDGKHLLSVGHDILLNDLVERVTADHLAGTYNFIFRPDGRLIAHPTQVAALGDNAGSVTIQSLNDGVLTSMYQQVMHAIEGNHEQAFVMDDLANNAILAVTRIAGPEWLFVTVYPKSLLASTARSVANFILGISFISLIVELIMLQLVMNGGVIRPLDAFMRASNAVGNGDYHRVASGAVELPESRTDEVGQLARTFRAMSKHVDDSHAQLLESEQRYRAVFNGSRDVILITRMNGEIVDANPAVEPVFGYSAEEILASNAEILHVDKDERRKLIEANEAAGFVVDFEIAMRRKDGSAIDTLVTSNLTRDEKGQAVGLQYTIRDITLQKEAERLRAQYRAQLELDVAARTRELAETMGQLEARTVELKSAHDVLVQTQEQLVLREKMASLGTLTAGVAHEINNPVNFADGALQNLESELQTLHQFLRDLAGEEAPPEVLTAIAERFEKLRQMTTTAREGHHRIKIIVRDLRQFTRLDEAERKMVPIAEPIQSTINLVRTRFDRIRFDLDLEFNPPIECQPAKLGQMFMNLIVNACEAILRRADGTEGLVGITTTRIPDGIEIIVADNGCGMQATVRDRAFEPFFTTKSVGAGTGLGLATVFGIVKEHHGTIDIESTPNRGSRFVLRLPLAA